MQDGRRGKGKNRLRKSLKFCENHPYVRATTRCYYCKKDICKDCRLHLAHHYFCSRKCYALFRLSAGGAFLKKHQIKIVYAWIFLLSIGIAATFFYATKARDHSEKANDESLNSIYAPFPREMLSHLGMDSIIQLGKEIRTKIMNERLYNLNIPLQKGWIINIWQNDYPELSQTIDESKDYQLPIDLKYGKNRLKVAVWDSRQNLVYSDYFEITYQNPVVEILRRSVERGSRQNARLSLTFDGGSNAAGAEEILNALQSRQITTTIFLTGQFVLQHPELVMRMKNAHHEIANHTFNHPHLTNYSSSGEHTTLAHVNRPYLQKQLIQTDSAYFALTGQHLAPFWRAPYGEYNQEILDWAAECGYMHVRWTQGFDTFDWVEDHESPIYQDSQEVLANIFEKDTAQSSLNGAIILMHLGSTRSQDPVYKIVPDLIDKLYLRGYAIVPVGDLINF